VIRTPNIGAAILAGMQQARAKAERPPSMEEFVTSPELCAFGKASDVQRALVCAADGLVPRLDPERMLFHFGDRNFVPPSRPSLVCIEAGVRSAKSMLSALCGNLYSALYADVSVARPGELIKSLIVAPRIEQARSTFKHALGTLQESPKLSKHLVSSTLESATVRRPDGKLVEIRLVAAGKGGTKLRSTWLTGCVFSEADFFDAEDAAVNLADSIDAVRGRIVPGGQVYVESSPWADTGPFHKLVTDFFGRPSAEKGIIVFHSDSRSMFPNLEREAEAQMRAADPDKASREFDAIPISTSGSDFFPMAAVRACVNMDRDLILPPKDRTPHFGGTDLGFRKNSSAVAFARWEGGKVRLAYHEELRPQKGEPLKPSVVCSSFARRGIEYLATSVRGDYHEVNAAIEFFAAERGPGGRQCLYMEWVPSMENQVAAFAEFKRLMLEGLLELPNDPRLLLMIEKTKMKPAPGGRVSLVLPKQGWAHGDLLMAVVLACTQVPTHEPASATAWNMPANDSRWSDSEGRGY
jgi:hypothetical protein